MLSLSLDAPEMPSPRRRPRLTPLVVPRPPTSLPLSFYTEGDEEVGVVVGGVNHRAATGSVKGRRRRVNEDRVFCEDAAGVYGVCDGHGGTVVAQACAELLPDMLRGGMTPPDAFAAVQEAAVRLVPENSYVGATLAVAQVARGDRLVVSHVGDSRVVLLDFEGRATTLTTDHVPGRPDESERITAAGGAVLRGRVNGVLAVSRALGDTALIGMVSHVPDVAEHALRPDDQLLILASDGLWDFVEDSDAAAMLRSLPLIPGSIAVPCDLPAAARGLIDLAVSRGSTDDCSVVLVDLRKDAAPPMSS